MSKTQKSSLFAVAFLVLAIVTSLAVPQAVALAGPVTPDSCAVTCGTSATPIVCDGIAVGGFSSVYIQNLSTTTVAIGDSALSTTTAPLICNDAACANVAQWSGDARGLYCRGSSSQSIRVIAGK